MTRVAGSNEYSHGGSVSCVTVRVPVPSVMLAVRVAHVRFGSGESVRMVLPSPDDGPIGNQSGAVNCHSHTSSVLIVTRPPPLTELGENVKSHGGGIGGHTIAASALVRGDVGPPR